MKEREETKEKIISCKIYNSAFIMGSRSAFRVSHFWIVRTKIVSRRSVQTIHIQMDNSILRGRERGACTVGKVKGRARWEGKSERRRKRVTKRERERGSGEECTLRLVPL